MPCVVDRVTAVLDNLTAVEQALIGPGPELQAFCRHRRPCPASEDGRAIEHLGHAATGYVEAVGLDLITGDAGKHAADDPAHGNTDVADSVRIKAVTGHV